MHNQPAPGDVPNLGCSLETQNKIVLAPDLKENLAKADKFEAEVVKQVDEYIEKNGLEAPKETLPNLRDGYEPEEIINLDLKSEGITSVIWATGYKFDFGMVQLPAFDEDGYPGLFNSEIITHSRVY